MSTKRNKLKTTNRKTIQIFLIFLGFLLIAITYFIYPRLIQQPIQEKVVIELVHRGTADNQSGGAAAL